MGVARVFDWVVVCTMLWRLFSSISLMRKLTRFILDHFSGIGLGSPTRGYAHDCTDLPRFAQE